MKKAWSTERMKKSVHLIKIKDRDRDQRHKAAMFVLRPLIALIVAVALTLSGTAVAARSFHGPVEQVEICADGETKTVSLDARGNPVAPNQCCGCLDCLSLAVDLSVTASLRQASQTLQSLTSVPVRSILPVSPRHLRPSPRGPPIGGPADDRLSPVRLFLVALEFGQVRHGKAASQGGQTTKVAR